MRQIEMLITCTANLSEYNYGSPQIIMWTRNKLNDYTTMELWKEWIKNPHNEKWLCTRSRYNVTHFYRKHKTE